MFYASPYGWRDSFVGVFNFQRDMKSSIKLKHGSKLQGLLKKPEELALLIRIAFEQDEETGFAKGIKQSGALSNLLMSGLVKQTEEGVGVVDKSVVEITLRKKSAKELKLNRIKLAEVKKEDVPKELQKPYEIAKSFRDLFKHNLETLGVRTNNVDSATFEKWVTPIRLMLTEDEVTMEQFREVWKFLKGHKFWSDKVQSTQKLRDKFETIHGQIKGDERRKQEQGNSGTGNVSAEYASQVLRDLQSE